MSQHPADHDPARTRLMVMHLMRWTGLALVLLGLVVIYRPALLPFAVPVEAGYAIFVIGLIDALIAPSLLARAWRSR